jgi:hypothetical protein
VTRLAGGSYRWPGLDEPKWKHPFLRFLASPLALTVVLVRYSVEAKNLLLFLRVRGEVGEKKVKERGENDAFVAVSDEDEGCGMILSVIRFSEIK